MTCETLTGELDVIPGDSTCGDSHLARVLVVDDENGPRQALRMLLKTEYDVMLASGPDAALRTLRQCPVDVVITDIRMPGATGIDLLRAVKQDWPDIEVIILTGYGQLDTAMSAIDLGAFAYVEKPFDAEVILGKVRDSLARRRENLEHRALEELAFRASRFETLGRLITGTMHDLGTPLSVMNANVELLMNKVSEPEAAARLQTIQVQLGHCTDLVRTTMNFLRHAPAKRAPFSLNAVVRTCIDMAGPVLTKDGVEIQVELDPVLPPLMGELILVRQALLNLLTNAGQAMHGQAAPKRISLSTWREEDKACLRVEDTGPGIPAHYRARIFDALFTTKAESGTGLGLAVVKHVMEHHFGTIELIDPPGGGTDFVLRFPVPFSDGAC